MKSVSTSHTDCMGASISTAVLIVMLTVVSFVSGSANSRASLRAATTRRKCQLAGCATRGRGLVLSEGVDVTGFVARDLANGGCNNGGFATSIVFVIFEQAVRLVFMKPFVDGGGELVCSSATSRCANACLRLGS